MASSTGERSNGAGFREVLRWPTRLERRIALRYMKGRAASRALSLNTLISVGGVAVGVMALIVVLGVMNGLRNDLRDRILVANPHLRILTFGSGLRLDDWHAVIDQVRKEPGVVAAAPEVISQSLISAGADYVEGVQIVGFDPDTGARSVTSLPQALTRGDMTFHTTRTDVDGGIILGYRLAQRLSVFPGDQVTLVPPKAGPVNPALGYSVPRYWRFEVTGLFNTGMFQYDNQFVVISREVAQRFTGLGDAVSGITVRVTDPWKAPEIGHRLEEKLGYPYRALDWQSQNETLFSALELEKAAMGLIIFFIMVVAAFNIVGTLTMVVADKTREIGILQAMGLGPGAVARIFLAQGALIGLIGVSLGLTGGLAIATAVDRWKFIKINPTVYFIDHLPVQVEGSDVLIVVLASLFVAVAATIHPSRTAARLQPVEAIRHE